MQSELLVVNTPESVDLKLELAGLGSRFLAVAIDTLIQMAVLLLILLVALLAGWVDPNVTAQAEKTMESSLGIALLLLAVWLLFYFYYVLFEVAWEGQTPGKRLAGLRVLDRSGRPASAGALVIRNLVRLVDSLPMPIAYPGGVISFLSTPLGQRLGDLAAGTIVMRERRMRLPEPGKIPGHRQARVSHVPPDTAAIAATISRVTPEELDLVRQFLTRRGQLRWDIRSNLAARVANRVAMRMGYTKTGGHPEDFLEAVLQAEGGAARGLQ